MGGGRWEVGSGRRLPDPGQADSSPPVSPDPPNIVFMLPPCIPLTFFLHSPHIPLDLSV